MPVTREDMSWFLIRTSLTDTSPIRVGVPAAVSGISGRADSKQPPSQNPHKITKTK